MFFIRYAALFFLRLINDHIVDFYICRVVMNRNSDGFCNMNCPLCMSIKLTQKSVVTTDFRVSIRYINALNHINTCDNGSMSAIPP
jgi:hypothetical protein